MSPVWARLSSSHKLSYNGMAKLPTSELQSFPFILVPQITIQKIVFIFYRESTCRSLVGKDAFFLFPFYYPYLPGDM